MCCGHKASKPIRCPKCKSIMVVTNTYVRCRNCGLMISKEKILNKEN